MPGTHRQSNVSADLIWEVTRTNNSYLVKRNGAGGVQFSRDPFNLVNKNSRKHAGFANDKAFGIHQGDRGSIVLKSKKTKDHNRPASNLSEVPHGGHRSGPRVYKSIVSSTAKNGYRSDLRGEAVSRASALRKSSRPVKESPEKKPRGAKAKKAIQKD